MSKSEDKVAKKRIKELQQLQLKPLADCLYKLTMELINMNLQLNEIRGRLDLLEVYVASESHKEDRNGCARFVEKSH